MLMTEEQARINPIVNPWWRWETAQQLASKPARGRRSKDPLIRDAAQYLRSGDAQQFPAIHAAREIYEADGLERAEIEARILAGQSDEEIGERCHVSPHLVAVYHDLFFWVRDYLQTDWVIRNTVGMGRHVGFRDDEFRQLWAFEALAGGPLIVDLLKQGYQNLGRSSDTARLSSYLGEDCDISKVFRARIALLTIPKCKATKPWLIEIGLRIMEIRAISDAATKEKAFNRLLDEVIRLGRRVHSGEALEPPPVRESNEQSRPFDMTVNYLAQQIASLSKA